MVGIIISIQLGKRVRQAERDVVEWRGKWELSQRKLLELVEEHKKKTEEAEASKKRADRLAGLCRALREQLPDIHKPSLDVTGNSYSNKSVQPNGDGPNDGPGDSEHLPQVCPSKITSAHYEPDDLPSSTVPSPQSNDQTDESKQIESIEPDESSSASPFYIWYLCPLTC